MKSNLDAARQEKRNVVRIAAIISGISGLVILISSIWPIIQYQLTDAKSYTTLLSPIKNEKADLTKVANWFPDAELPKTAQFLFQS